METAAIMPDLNDYATHSDFSDPGDHAAALAHVGADPVSLHAFVTGVVVHYYAGVPTLTPTQLADVDLRWVSRLLDTTVERAPGLPLAAARPLSRKLGGCCRDHSLLAVSVLRERGIPARTRLGFVDYLGAPGLHVDHVVAERHDGERWVRFDPELDRADHGFDTHDMPTGESAPFATAAEVWLAYREGRLDLSSHGAGAGGFGLTGPGFVQRYVIGDLAHRQRCELLLWDLWGAMPVLGAEPEPSTLELTDEVAALTVRADAGDRVAEAALSQRWVDERLRPTRYVTTWSPTRRLGWTDLVDRTTSWTQLPPTPAR